MFSWQANILSYPKPLFLSLMQSHLESLACTGNPCENGATCYEQNGDLGYLCLCPAGYEGTNCETGTCHISRIFEKFKTENDYKSYGLLDIQQNECTIVTYMSLDDNILICMFHHAIMDANRTYSIILS